MASLRCTVGILLCFFLYRYWLIGGVGGYQTHGHADVLNFSVWQSAKALFWRVWAITFFPLNWSLRFNWFTCLAIILFCAALGIIAVFARVNRLHLLAALATLLLASAPIQQLLLIGSDLAGTRVLYLPMLGIALLWAVIMDSKWNKISVAFAALGAVLFFNLVALEWDVGIWTGVAEESRAVCSTFGSVIRTVAGPVEVGEIPYKLRGVYFLLNGFPQCVELNSGVPASKITKASSTVIRVIEPGTAAYRWDAQRFQFVPAR